MRLPLLALVGGVLLAGPLRAQGESPDALRAGLQIPLVPVERADGATPAVTVSSPSGYGADGGLAFAGAGFQERTRFTNTRDAALVVGLGLGDARRTVGLEVAATSYSLGRRHAPGAVGSVSFKLHRMLPGAVAVAGGVENAVHWGDTDAGRSVYGSVSHLFLLNGDPRLRFGAVVLTAGAGNGRFRTEHDVETGKKTISPFGSLALFVARPVTVVADWTGQDLAVGTSFVPFQRVPLVITPALADLTHRAGDGARFVLGVGYGIRFRSPL
jgi:hypothetical protein